MKLLYIISVFILSTECPEEFFRLNGSYRCFKIFEDEERNWLDADKKCQHEGLRMPINTDDIAVDLTKYLLENYGM